MSPSMSVRSDQWPSVVAPAGIGRSGRGGHDSPRIVGCTDGRVLKAKKVQQLSGVNYERIDDDGLHISFGQDRKSRRVLAVDNVIICAGQDPVRDLEEALRRRGIDPHIIGGAALAVELDAERAIKQGTELAARL